MCLFTNCTSSGNNLEKKQEKQKVQPSNGEWQKMSPLEIKNAIELFNKDWMELAVGTL